jgi:Ni/Fe-hydrogenase b-type cytochrome subunit
MRRVYLYSRYERFWHWLQAVLILLLVITGIEIHWPQMRILGFAGAVDLHNTLAFILLANALFSLFYHLTTGAIQHYLPEPQDFFSMMGQQARYYFKGIFAHEPHPFEKDAEHKLNPLQQIAYLFLLNLLLPLQVITGLLLWGAQRWPEVLRQFGGIALVAQVHTLGAWLFVVFIVVHVYLTTTGHAPLSLIKAMITGYEEMTDDTESNTEVSP